MASIVPLDFLAVCDVMCPTFGHLGHLAQVCDPEAPWCWGREGALTVITSPMSLHVIVMEWSGRVVAWYQVALGYLHLHPHIAIQSLNTQMPVNAQGHPPASLRITPSLVSFSPSSHCW